MNIRLPQHDGIAIFFKLDAAHHSERRSLPVTLRRQPTHVGFGVIRVGLTDFPGSPMRTSWRSVRTSQKCQQATFATRDAVVAIVQKRSQALCARRRLFFPSTQPLHCSSIVVQRRNRKADSRLPRPRGVMPERPFSRNRSASLS